MKRPRTDVDVPDDGHTIADMSDVRGHTVLTDRGQQDVLSADPYQMGLPPDQTGSSSYRETSYEGASATHKVAQELQDPKERLAVILGTLKAALTIWAVFVVAFAIVIALMIGGWVR
jgi:hypothetical protein